MQVVVTLSLKGGVGKTTVALGLAGAALQHGVRCLLVDLDPQANATTALDVGPTSATVADVLDDPRRSVVRRAITPSGWGAGLDVLVGGEQTERHNHPDPGLKQLTRLSRALQRLAEADDGDHDHDGGRPAERRRGRTRDGGGTRAGGRESSDDADPGSSSASGSGSGSGSSCGRDHPPRTP